MKKLIAITVTIIFLITLGACSGKNKTNLSSSVGETSVSDSSETSENNVIAKSDNVVTDKDKQAVLDDLNKELDNLLSDINEEDNVEDDDLSIP